MARKKSKKPKQSLIIGFCICANCGYTDGKFNWHTYFKCPECGCKEYCKEADPFDERPEDSGNDN